jgi:hypothetical protein
VVSARQSFMPNRYPRPRRQPLFFIHHPWRTTKIFCRVCIKKCMAKVLCRAICCCALPTRQILCFCSGSL